MYGEFGVPLEVEQGIVQLLFSAAFPTKESTPFTVITQDYSLWLSQYPHLPVTLVDVSLVFPKDSVTFWLSEKELQLVVKRRLLSSGWSPEQVVGQYHPPRDRSALVPDFGLLTQDGKLVAIVQVKNSKLLLGEPLSQAIMTAKDLGARFALLTNGRQVQLFDTQIDLAVSRNTYPTPDEIGLDVQPFDLAKSAREKGPVSLVTITNEKEFVTGLNDLNAQTLIIDHTLPWGMTGTDELRLFGNRLGVSKKSTLLDLPTQLMLRVAPMDSVGVLIGIVPQKLCLSSSDAAVRQELLNYFDLKSLIELPSDLFKPRTSIRSSLLAFKRPSSDGKNRSYVFAVSSRDELLDVSERPWFTGIKKGFLGIETNVGFYSVVRKNDPWTAAAHDPGSNRFREEISKYPSLPLEEICDVFQGFRHSREEVLNKKGIPTLRGRDISRKIDLKEELSQYGYREPPPEHFKIRAGDVLLQRIGASPSCMIATPGISDAIASDTVFVIRPKQESANPSLIWQFLSSRIGQQLLSSVAVGAYAPSLSVAALRKLPIPQVSFDLSRDLDELSEIEQALRAKADKLRSLRLDLFGIESKGETARRLREVRQTAKAISTSIQQAETLDFQVRNFYPYPLAFSYRSLSGITTLSDLYREQLRLAENVLSFLASVSLAIILERDRTRIGLELEKIWHGGISPGHWHEIAQRSSKVLREYENNRLAQSMGALWYEKDKEEFRLNVEKLIHAKNDFKHDRGPKTDEDIQKATIQIQTTLQDCMRDLGFLTEHSIMLIREISGVRGSRLVSINTLLCMGDHPGFTQRQLTYPEALIKNDLYIEIEKDSWTALHPFIVPHNCPQCKNREFYFVDRWQGEGKPATLKSFEQGHTQSVDEVGMALSKW